MSIKKIINFLSGLIKRTDCPEDRRRSDRISVVARVEYTVLDNCGKRTSHSAMLNYARNISDVGLCLITYEPLERGTILSLKIVITAYAVMEVKGIVIWQSRFAGDDDRPRFNTGIRFEDLVPRLQRKLQRYVNHLLAIPPASSERNFIPL